MSAQFANSTNQIAALKELYTDDKEYMKEYRDRNPEYTKRSNQQKRARNKADTDLKNKYYSEWLKLYTHYLKAEEANERSDS